MPERYVLYETNKLTDRFHLKNGVPRGVKPNYNISPTQLASVIVRQNGFNEMRPMKWGFIPANAKDTTSVFRYKTFVTKREAIFNKNSTSKSIRSQRCLVPMNGFYEWQKTDNDKRPFYVKPKGPSLGAFAGIYSSWEDPAGKTWGTFSIITTSSNVEMNTLSPRMPIILRPDEEAAWLDPSVDDIVSISHILRPPDDDTLTMRLTNREVNNPRARGESLINPPVKK